jgi:hypothetical protein
MVHPDFEKSIRILRSRFEEGMVHPDFENSPWTESGSANPARQRGVFPFPTTVSGSFSPSAVIAAIAGFLVVFDMAGHRLRPCLYPGQKSRGDSSPMRLLDVADPVSQIALQERLNLDDKCFDLFFFDRWAFFERWKS